MRTRWLAPLSVWIPLTLGCGPTTGGQSGAEILDDPQQPNVPDVVSPGAQGGECVPAECQAQVAAELSKVADAAAAPPAFTSSRCSKVSIIGERSVSGMACECEGAGGAMVGPVGLGCFVFGRSGECLFDDSEFSGCNGANPESCDAICAELHQRLSDDAAATHQTNVVYADCVANTCESVVRIDGQCFATGSYTSRRAYDCTEEPSQITASERAAKDPLKGLSEVPTESSMYLEGTSGFAQVTVSDSFTGTYRNGPHFGASAQFFHTTGSTSFEFGKVIDPLEGVDDCGRTITSGTGASNDPDFFAIESAALLDGDQRYALEEFASGFGFFTYDLDLTALGAEPRFRQRYGVLATGGELTAPLQVDDLLLPEALSFPELRQLTHIPRGDIHLTWTGQGDEPLNVTIYVTAHPGIFLGPFELHCLLQDDGEFTLKQELFADAPDGILRAYFSRGNRFVDRSGEQSLLTVGSVEVTHNLAFGEQCDNAAVLEACQAFAAHYAAENAECAGTYEQPLEERCPAYLATSCTGCVEYYECLSATTQCEDGTLNSDVCGCGTD